MNLAVWRGVRLAAEAECGENDKGLNGGLHWLVWLYCHKRDKGRLKTGFFGVFRRPLFCLKLGVYEIRFKSLMRS
ncbi:hypothetical protein NM96_11890 [Neisseria mucosa]|nr:hypothetical protein NM96_11890 [Neisseria mucosa]